ncbi:adenyl-nucleotide exchange factor sse1 [Fusarium odoratissimum]|uniref:Heat shock 70kDa protein 4 n=15 Tax=Fusarium oxysporum species complex TaxID=171631 RepID=W9J1P2_FUSOX|nr:heat shock 70kDa protein 4 [Fusarium oxysporum f. sp. lycopersici 4287]XP_031049810.1 heat shock protein 70 family [Fusarium oxysporum Fo47]XP_031064641.1 heat shock 70kDa protein 4 [Fusarium odoratissimum NRRL 54006]EWZ00893.1 heat shock 70kDa protein 4 [Fusarium oxysporum NRRL 32931]EWZ82092.1 heat shock 70kDa protein 4 [Fusarium oxysporum f. sp. lycopersici MN25]EXA43494.1 heat shock 70kDa protein 4 [Fusarium oxysporum f. sp. pisi HDV247]EXK44238.1 heat shock 70kDa protein 4 [Fusarium o
MSVVGIDFGTLKTVIAVARNRGVDVVTNEVSNRATPSLVGFGPKSRYLGEAAKTQEISNLKNTVSSLKRLAGRQFNDPDIQIEQQYVTAPLADCNGQVGAEVNYLGKKEKFTATQLVAMYLSKIKQTAGAELKLPVQDVCLSVPPWFTDVQRRALIDAAEIAGLRVLRLINDGTAAALGWGITKLDLPAPEEAPRRVCFVDIGHSSYTVSIVEFKKGELAVKATTWDKDFGGRDFDRALVDHLAKEFKGKYKVDIMTHGRALARTIAAAEKTKKILSANQQAPVNIESLMNDIDASAMITRQEFEAMIEPLLARTHLPLEEALAQAKLTKDDIDVIEVVGGGSRVPALKERIQEFFGKPLSFTLNADEALARGSAFSCAILSPVFRVRDFSVQDIISYPIEFAWEKAPDIPDEDTSLTVFNKGNVMPSTKILTFYRKQPFDLEARYAQPELLPGKTNPWIGRFSVKNVKADGKDDFMICKLKARVNIHGVLNVETGYYVEEEEVEEEVNEDPDVSLSEPYMASNDFPPVHDQDSASSSSASVGDDSRAYPAKRPRLDDEEETDSSRSAFAVPEHLEESIYEPRSLTSVSQKAMETDKDAPKKTRKVKKQVRKGDLPISTGSASLDDSTKASLLEKEAAMVMEDKLVADTEEKKNELEAYIYDLRAKLDEQYSEFASEEEKQTIKAKLEATEDWLYEEGDDTTKGVYVAKIDEIRAMAGPIVQRHFEKVEAERQAALEKAEAERAAKKAEEDARKAAEAEKANTDQEMKDADAPQQETEGSADPQ